MTCTLFLKRLKEATKGLLGRARGRIEETPFVRYEEARTRAGLRQTGNLRHDARWGPGTEAWSDGRPTGHLKEDRVWEVPLKARPNRNNGDPDPYVVMKPRHVAPIYRSAYPRATPFWPELAKYLEE